MKRVSKPMINLFSVVLGGLALVLAMSRMPSEDQTVAGRPPVGAIKLNVQTEVPDQAPIISTSFAPAVKKAAPSVVSVYSTRTVRDEPDNPLLKDPLFRHFFGDDSPVQADPHARPRRSQSLGAGVICTPDGYILTNFHVVEDAEEIKVGMADDHTEFTARVIGTDPKTDVAVIKIDATNLPPITIGNSDSLQVGDVVLAVGNPFGVGQTVTMGIISATGRGGFGVEDIEDFIQTDASINPGNSGGALVDAEGRLVGLNTAILSRTGANQGLGFAVPINLARNVMENIVQFGKVVRGYLGVSIQSLTPELSAAFNLPGTQSGALVGGIAPNSPASKAGLKEGDVITSYDGHQVNDSRELRLKVAKSSPNSSAALEILRDGRKQEINATLGEMPQAKTTASAKSNSKRLGKGQNNSNQGALDDTEITDLSGQLRRALDVPLNVRGALVSKVEPESDSFIAGLRTGDVIMEVNRQPVTDARTAIQLSRNSRGRSVLLRVWSKDGSHYVALKNEAMAAK